MFYKRDFAPFREYAHKLQIFSRKVHNRAERREKFQKFSDNFTLHGFSNIFYRNVHDFERYLWTLVVAAAIIATIYACAMLSNKYSDRTIITVVDNSKFPVFNVEFPAVAMCTKHRVNWGRVPQARKKFLPPDADNATVKVFNSFVERLDSLEFRALNSLAGLEQEPTHLLDSISLRQLASYLAFRCKEVISECMWSEQPFDCCKWFVQEKTGVGICLVFNSVVSKESEQKAVNDKLYPQRNSKNGEGSGLAFTVKRDSLYYLPGGKDISGVELMVKKPDQWTEGKTYRLRPHTYNGVIVKPETTTTDDELKYFPQSLRQCLFPHEHGEYHIPGLMYRTWNCKAQCHLAYVMRYCNCTLTLFFRTEGIQVRECTASDYICIYKNRDVFGNEIQPDLEKFIKQERRGMTCNCPISCNSLNYQINLNTVPIYNLSDVNTTIRVDVFYQSEVMLKYATRLKYTMFDLTGYFGGIVTLFLGASILSSVEMIHFALMMLMSYLNEKALNKRLTRKAKAIPT